MYSFGPPRLRRLLVVSMAIGALSACSSGVTNNGITPFAAQPSSVTNLPFGKASKALLFISDSGTNEVETFAWPKPATGTGLSGSFSEPEGECSDNAGDVFIVNTGDQNILEYNLARQLVKTFSDPGQYPVSCSFNTLNGELAVANIITSGDGAGSVTIFKVKGKPQNVAVTGLQRVYAAQYDGSGDLYAEGETSMYAPALAEQRSGSKKFETICPNLTGSGNIEFPGDLSWDGKYIVIGGTSQSTGGDGKSVVERIKKCKVVGTTPVAGGGFFTIAGDRIIVPDAGNADVLIYSYPQGELLYTLSGFSEPIGAAVAQDLKGK